MCERKLDEAILKLLEYVKIIFLRYLIEKALDVCEANCCLNGVKFYGQEVLIFAWKIKSLKFNLRDQKKLMSCGN